DTGGVSGASVSLDGGPAISPNSDGTFSFPSVGPGSHTITQTLPGVDADGNGWTATVPGSGDVYTLTTGRCEGTRNCATFTSGDTTDVVNQNFGDFHNVKISGVKYEDLNGNRNKDDNDPALSDLTIKLDQSGGG